ncbi:MAG: DNA internalization-related competence protein ComEC/Rec2, partial [Gammaproteobacteria bacterium]|nr:DNA internalization-related competence protein ComEC/Rec2 [Gammaproteobacteria bacterium]
HLGSNDRSCVLQIQVDSYRLLLLGDIERARERELVRYWGRNLRQDWLLVAHHGSATSSTHTLLKVMRPAMAVVSSGYANRFGHPHPDVLQRLRHVGARVLSTAESGALEFEFAPGEAPRVNRYRLQNRRFWM